MAIHHMSLDKKWFDHIRSGTKSYELRIWDPKRQQINPGDSIIFTNKKTGETCETGVVSYISGFETFRKALETFDYELVIPGAKNIDEACQVYYDIPGYKEGIKKYTAVVYNLAVI